MPWIRAWIAPFALAVLGLGWVVTARAERIVDAAYAAPVERYGHFALGWPHEYARLVARTDSGRALAFELPADAVFEDLAPRHVTLAPDGEPLLLVIVSTRTAGARLALAGLRDGALALVADGPPIGTPKRWLNPVGVADLDGDGVAEIAAVTTPHIGGVLRVYRRQGDRLVEVDAMAGFSNHVYGASELALSTAVRIRDRWTLLVPDQARTTVRALTMHGDRLVETGRCAVPVPVDGPDAVRACAVTQEGRAAAR